MTNSESDLVELFFKRITPCGLDSSEKCGPAPARHNGMLTTARQLQKMPAIPKSRGRVQKVGSGSKWQTELIKDRDNGVICPWYVRRCVVNDLPRRTFHHERLIFTASKQIRFAGFFPACENLYSARG
jgi:hypothetical protein